MTGTMVPPELRAVMKLSLEKTRSIVKASDNGLGAVDPNDPRIRKLLEHLYFSRGFIPTYYAVLAAALLVYAGVKRWNHRYRHLEGSQRDVPPASSPAASSSSSKTLRGSNTPVSKDVDRTETMPLLSEDRFRQPRQQTDLGRLWSTTQAFLMYQPAPIPALTSSKNTLPPNETALIILSLLAVNIFYFFFKLPLTRDMLFIVADRAALIFVVNLPVLYILAAKNNQPFKWLTGCSYEGLNLYHRRLGEWMTIAASIHAIAMFVIYWLIFKPIGLSLGWYVTRPLVLLGIFGIALYLIIYFTSIGYFRQKLYESFLLIHVTCQVAALVVLFFHHPGARPYVGAALAIWTLDRLVWRLIIKRRSFIATLQIATDKETVLLSISVPLRAKTLSRQDITAGWSPGQHIFVTIPSLGSTHILQTHPFTISSPAPPSNPKSRPSSWPLHLAIRAQNGFSRELLEHAQHHQHVKVHVDGPYSSREVLECIQASDRVCLIAGGSGIAVTFPFAAAMHEDMTQDKLMSSRVEYAGGVKKVPNLRMLDSPLDSVAFGHMWVRQSGEHESWVMAWPAIAGDSGGQEQEQGRALDVITHRFETRSSSHHQRPDMVAELGEWVRGDGKSRSDLNERICIVVSGPDALVREVRNAASRLVREGRKIEVHVEKFGW